MRPFFAATENADLADDGIGTETEQLENVVAATAEDNEINQEVADINTSFAEADTGMAASDELADVVELAEDSLENGEGLSEDAAKAATVAVEHIMLRLTGERQQSIVMAVESFSSSNSRVLATEGIIQGAKNMIANVWRRLKEFAISVWNRIKALFARIIGSSKMQSKNIEAMLQRVEKVPSDYVQLEKELENESLAKKFSVKKVADQKTFDAVAKSAISLKAFSEKLVASRAEMQEVVVSAFKNMAGGTNYNFDADLDRLSKLASAVNTGDLVQVGGNPAEFMDDVAVKGASKDAKVSGFGPFTGNRVLAIIVNKGKEEGATANFSVGFREVKGGAAKKAAALDLGGMKAVLKTTQDVNDSLEGTSKVFAELDKLTSKITKSIDEMLSVISKASEKKDDSAKQRRLNRELERNVRDSVNAMNALGTQAPAVVKDTVSAGLAYVEASLRNYGKKSKKN